MNPNNNDDALDGIRLQVWLARSGVASRRAAAEIVRNGRIRINGKVTCEPGARVAAEDVVTMDQRPVGTPQRHVYYVLHKPSRTLCSTADEEGKHRSLALDLVQPFVRERLFSVGRLDYMTSGLLLLTNDGDWSRKLAHPSCRIEKEYLVQTKKEVPEELLQEFCRGIRIQGEKYTCDRYVLTGPHSVRLVLLEGKNKEIRKVFESRNITVSRIHRLRVGSVTLRGIEAGRFRKLSEAEAKDLLAAGGPDLGHRH